MPAYHSKFNNLETEEACGCALLPLRSEVRGPAPPCPADSEDIIDEVIFNFRANVLFRNFEVKGGADRTLIYLTLHAVQLLVKAEKIEDKNTALREFRALSTKPFPIPGDATWAVHGVFNNPQNRGETDAFKLYFKQAREELAIRMCRNLFDDAGVKNKWWQAFSKRKFMGKELKD